MLRRMVAECPIWRALVDLPGGDYAALQTRSVLLEDDDAAGDAARLRVTFGGILADPDDPGFLAPPRACVRPLEDLTLTRSGTGFSFAFDGVLTLAIEFAESDPAGSFAEQADRAERIAYRLQTELAQLPRGAGRLDVRRVACGGPLRLDPKDQPPREGPVWATDMLVAWQG